MDAIVGGGWCAPSETIYDLSAGNSREHLLWSGLADPTPEERQAAADALYEQEVQDNANWFHTGVFLERVKAHEFDALQEAILELHHIEVRHGNASCEGCPEDDSYGPPSWPCPTVRLVLTHVGIDIPEELVHEKPAVVLQDNDNPRWPFPAGPVDSRLTIPPISVPRGGITFDRRDTP